MARGAASLEGLRLDRTRRVTASTRQHQTPRPSRVLAPRSRRPDASASTDPPRRDTLDRPPGRVLRLDARTHIAAAACRARPAAGRGEARRPPAPPMSAVATDSSAKIRASGWTINRVHETRSHCQASTPSPEACRAPRAPARHPWWRLRAPGVRPRISPWGNCQLIGVRSAEGRQPLDPRPDARSPALGPFVPCTPLAQTPLPLHQEGGKGAPAARSGPIRGVCRAHTRDSAKHSGLHPANTPARRAKHTRHQWVSMTNAMRTGPCTYFAHFALCGVFCARIRRLPRGVFDERTSVLVPAADGDARGPRVDVARVGRAAARDRGAARCVEGDGAGLRAEGSRDQAAGAARGCRRRSSRRVVRAAPGAARPADATGANRPCPSSDGELAAGAGLAVEADRTRARLFGEGQWSRGPQGGGALSGAAGERRHASQGAAGVHAPGAR